MAAWPLIAGICSWLSGTGCERKPLRLPAHLADGGAERVESGAVQLAGEIDVCPVVTFSVAPAEALPGQPVSVVAAASDADGDSLSYLWTAPEGSWLDGARSAHDHYVCAGPGRVRLSLAVSDGRCTVTRKAEVVCLMAADGGAPLPSFDGASSDAKSGAVSPGAGASGSPAVDGGPIPPPSSGAGGMPPQGALPPGADGGAGRSGAGTGLGGQGGTTSPAGGSGGMAGAGAAPSPGPGGSTSPCVPDDPTKDECSGCNACTSQNCVPAQTDCDGLDSDAKTQACRALYRCLRASGCAAVDINSCFCGPTKDVRSCWRGVVPANGPCAREIERAAESTDPSFVEAHFIDPDLALGRAVNLAGCRLDYCRDPSAAGLPLCTL